MHLVCEGYLYVIHVTNHVMTIDYKKGGVLLFTPIL